MKSQQPKKQKTGPAAAPTAPPRPKNTPSTAASGKDQVPVAVPQPAMTPEVQEAFLRQSGDVERVSPLTHSSLCTPTYMHTLSNTGQVNSLFQKLEEMQQQLKRVRIYACS